MRIAWKYFQFLFFDGTCLFIVVYTEIHSKDPTFIVVFAPSAIFRFPIQPGSPSIRQSKRFGAVQTTGFSAHVFYRANLPTRSSKLPPLTLSFRGTGEWLCKKGSPLIYGSFTACPMYILSQVLGAWARILLPSITAQRWKPKKQTATNIGRA